MWFNRSNDIQACNQITILSHGVTIVQYPASACEIVMWSPSQTGVLLYNLFRNR